MAKSKKVNQQAKQVIIADSLSTVPLNSKIKFTVEETISIGLLCCLILLIYIIRSKFLTIPFERDEGIYSYFGTLILEGKVPYKDFYEIKFPGLFYFYGFMVFVFGETIRGMHTGFMYLNIATIIIIYNASRQLFSPIAGLISAVTFAFVSLSPNLSGFTVQAEHGVAFFISLGILFYALSKKYNKWYLYGLMGLSMGIAFMVKTTGVFMCIWGGIIIVLDYVFTKPKNVKELIINIIAYSLGGISIIAVLFLIIFSKGAFGDMIFYTYELPQMYISNVPFEEGVKYFTNAKNAIIQYHKFFWIHSILAVVLCLFKTIDIKLKIFGITLLVFSFLTVVPGFYFYGHYLNHSWVLNCCWFNCLFSSFHC
jgi:4-amino-4-deoxy-L-arabinose transferase-like glycosyltransferase